MIPLAPHRALRTMVHLMSAAKSRPSNVVPLPVAPAPQPDATLLLVAALQQQVASQQQQLVALDARLRALEMARPMMAPEAPSAKPAANISEHRQRERDEIARALEQTAWNRIEAAKVLGMPRRTLYRRMEEYGLQNGDTRKKPSV